MSDAQLPWKWTRRFAVGLTISVAAFSAWGALAPHIPMPEWAAPMAAGVLMAALYGNSQGLANCMAANARRAWERGKGYHLPAFFFAPGLPMPHAERANVTVTCAPPTSCADA